MAREIQPWTADQDDVLRKMWLDGRSHLEISKAIVAAGGPERARGSIHGRRHQLGLPKRDCRLQARSTKTIEIKRRQSVTMAPGARIVPLVEIQHGECRFVVEEHPHLMCGAPVSNPGGAWCAFHRRLVYVPKGKVAEEIHKINSTAVMTVAQNPTARILQTMW